MASTQNPHQTDELYSHATKINFKPKLIKRDKEYYNIFTKGTMHREIHRHWKSEHLQLQDIKKKLGFNTVVVDPLTPHCHQQTAHPDQNKQTNKHSYIISCIKWTKRICTEYSIQQLQNMHSFHYHMDLFQNSSNFRPQNKAIKLQFPSKVYFILQLQ